MLFFRTIIPVFVLAKILFSAVSAFASESVSAPEIISTIRPVQLIANSMVQGVRKPVRALLPPGVTPHDYALKISDVRRVKEAGLIVWLGPDVEPYLKKIMQHRAKTEHLDLSALAGIKRLSLRSLEMDEHAHHSSHYPGNHNTQHPQQWDAHLWLSRHNAELIASALLKRLKQMDSANAARYQQNHQYLKQQLVKLDHYQDAFKEKKASFIVHHDAYQYLEHFMGLKPTAIVTVEPEISPGVRQITKIAQIIRDEDIKCFVGGPTLSSRLPELLFKGRSADSYQVLRLDPLAGGEFKSYPAFMEDMFNRFVECVSK